MRDNVSGGALTETSLLVLLALCEKRHGYGVKQWIEEMTDGRVSLGMGTLYGAINNMEEKGWIEKHSREGNRINYEMTSLGREQIFQEEERLKELLDLVKHGIAKFGEEEAHHAKD